MQMPVASTVESQKNQVAFLFGAGASMEAGVPDTVSLINEFRVKDDDANVSEFLELLGRWAKQQDRPLDIELVLETLQRLADWKEDPLSGFADKPIKIDGLDAQTLLNRLRDFIKNKVLVDAEHITYLEPLRGFIDAYRPLHLYSANYDTAIEVLCAEHKLKYRDGFDEAWNPALLDEPNVDLRLFKLHGSVTWYRSNRGRFLKIPVLLHDSSVELVTKERAEALMLYPAQKFEYVEPLFELLLAAKRRLAESQVLIVVGYSFRDEHIRQLLWDIARESPRFIVILIGPKARDIYQERLKWYERDRIPSALQGRVLCLPFLFGRVFPALQPELLPRVLQFREDLEQQLAQERRGHPGIWEGAVLNAARGGDYEVVRRILEKPQVLAQQLNYAQQFDCLVLSLFHAAANSDVVAGRYFWDKLHDTLREIIDRITLNVQFGGSSSWLVVSVNKNNRSENFQNLIRGLAAPHQEIDRRRRWMGDAESSSEYLRAVNRVLTDLQSAMQIWSNVGQVAPSDYAAARQQEIPGDLKGEILDKLDRLREKNSESWSDVDERQLEQGLRGTEQAVINKVFQELDQLWGENREL